MTKYLRLGTYYYQEKSCPNERVIIDDTQYDFVLSKNEQILEAHVENELITGSLTIYKVDEKGNYLNGVTFTLVDEAGKEIATATTSGNGIAKFDNLLPGKYNFKEVDAPVTVVKEEKPEPVKVTRVEKSEKQKRIEEIKNTPNMEICREFNRITRDGKNMQHYSDLLGDAIASIINVKEESDIDSFLSGVQGSLFTEEIRGLDDFELICFLVIK